MTKGLYYRAFGELPDLKGINHAVFPPLSPSKGLVAISLLDS
jgi:hypothetical protein